MTNVIGLAIFALGVVLVIFGLNATQSFSSDVSRFFTGSPTDRSIWLLLGGVAAIVGGLVLALKGARRSSR